MDVLFGQKIIMWIDPGSVTVKVGNAPPVDLYLEPANSGSEDETEEIRSPARPSPSYAEIFAKRDEVPSEYGTAFSTRPLVSVA